MAEPTLFLAFFAGLLSFLSPCILPLLPAFLSYLSGTTIGQGRIKVFLNSFFFVLGFSTIFSLAGVLLNTFLSSISYSVQLWLSRIGGIIIIAFAFHTLGLINISFLEREHKFSVKKNSGYATSFLFGAAFAAGWTPCVGAILGTVLTLAITKPTLAFFLLLSYSLGLGIPFLLVGVFTSEATKLINKSQTFLKYFNLVTGILLLLIGILVFTNKLILLANLFAPPL